MVSINRVPSVSLLQKLLLLLRASSPDPQKV